MPIRPSIGTNRPSKRRNTLAALFALLLTMGVVASALLFHLRTHVTITSGYIIVGPNVRGKVKLEDGWSYDAAPHRIYLDGRGSFSAHTTAGFLIWERKSDVEFRILTDHW